MIIPAQLTSREVDFMISCFNLQKGSKVLDIMCGYGRHAITLAQKGIEVTAVDNLGDYINEINEKAGVESLPVKAIKTDIVLFEANELFDLAICMGNSINFFPENEVLKIFSNLSLHLKPGGHLLINSWSIAEIAIRNFKNTSSSEINGIQFLTDSDFLFHPTRMESKSTMIAPDGTTETKTGIDYIFSIAELERMLTQTGFILKDIYSIPGKKKFTLGEPRAYLVAEKV